MPRPRARNGTGGDDTPVPRVGRPPRDASSLLGDVARLTGTGREGLRRFAAAGMTYAIVGVELDNPGAEALYRSVGIRSDRLLRGYERP